MDPKKAALALIILAFIIFYAIMVYYAFGALKFLKEKTGDTLGAYAIARQVMFLIAAGILLAFLVSLAVLLAESIVACG